MGRLKRTSQRPSFSKWYRSNVSATDPDLHTRKSVREHLERQGISKFHVNYSPKLYWNTLASNFNKLVSLKIVKSGFDYISTMVRFSGSENVLSIGSATGVIENYIAKYRVPNGTVTAIDLAHEMNLQSKKLSQQVNVSNLHLVTADVASLPVKRNSQDIILLVQPNFPLIHIKEVIRNARATIKNSNEARLILTTIVKEESKINDLRNYFAENNFRILHEKIERGSTNIDVYFTVQPIGKSN